MAIGCNTVTLSWMKLLRACMCLAKAQAYSLLMQTCIVQLHIDIKIKPSGGNVLGEYNTTMDVHRKQLHVYLLDISRQLACMKLGRREKYQPIQYCWAGCLGYPVHTCHLPIDIQQIYCSAQTGQHSHLQRSCCPVWALQHIYTARAQSYSLLTQTCIQLKCIYIHLHTYVAT